MAAGFALQLLYTLAAYKLVLAAFILGIVFAKEMHRYYTSPFRKQRIPGPFLARFTNLYRFYYVLRRTWHRDLITLHEKYGPVIWIAPDEISVSDPKLRNVIYGFANEKKEETFFPKAPMFETGQINNDFSFVFEQDPARARMGKYSMSHFYSEQGLSELEVNFDRAVEEFVEGLKRHHVESGKHCDLSKWSHLYTFDLITQLSCDYSPGFCLAGEDMHNTNWGLRLIFDLIGTLMALPITLTITTRWIRKMLVVTPLEQLYRSSLCFGNGKSKDERILEIKDNAPKHLLARFFNAQLAMKKKFPVGNHADGTTNHLFNLIAGAVGVASSLVCATVANLLTHPEVLAKLRKEIDTLGTDHVPLSALLRYGGNKNRVPYLEAVILESIRTTPAVGFSLARIVPPAGCYLHDYYIPPGYVVGMSAWPVNYDKSYFGEDAAEFKPERWLGDHPTELALDGSGKPRTMRAYLEGGWLSFGAGARVCAGRHLALFSLMKATGKIFKEFDLKLVQEPKEWYGLFIEEDGMKVSVKRRGESYTSGELSDSRLDMRKV